jgi:hypothetical protein
MLHIPATRLLLTASIGLLLSTQPGFASEGQANPELQQAPTASESQMPAVEQAGVAASAEDNEAADTSPDVDNSDESVQTITNDDVAAEETTENMNGDEVATTQTPTETTTEDPLFASIPIDMNHADWPALIVRPIDGSVTHNPHFTGNPPMGDDVITPLHAPDPVWQIQEALAGADAGNLNGENLTDLGAQPFIGLAQFVVMPLRMVIDNPLSETTSP